MIQRPIVAAALIGVLLLTATGASAQRRNRRPVVKILRGIVRANQPVGPDETSVGLTVKVRARRATVKNVRAWAVLKNATNRPSSPVSLTFRPNKGGWVGRVTIPRNSTNRTTSAEIWAEARSNLGVTKKLVATVNVKANRIDPNQPPPPPDI